LNAFAPDDGRKPHIHPTAAESFQLCSAGSPVCQQHAIEVILMTSVDIRAALERHWAASDANDFETEHDIYRDDAILDYPQSGERIRSRRNIQLSRTAQPSKKRFDVKRILGKDDLWVTELVMTYDGQPSYVVSIMEFQDGQVAHETQYFGDAFAPGPSRAQWVELMR
jgi:SnoaL-like domain